MTNKIHREVDVQANMKIVVSLRGKQFNSLSQIESAIAAIDYAGKEHLRLRGSITGTGTILGNVMILDVNIPLHTTNSHDVQARYHDFNMAVVKYLTNGKYHVSADKTLGGFGTLNVGYVSQNPATPRKVTVRVETELNDAEIRETVENLGGRVLSVREGTVYDRYGYPIG